MENIMAVKKITEEQAEAIRREYKAAAEMDRVGAPSTADPQYADLWEWWQAVEAYPTPNVNAVEAKYGRELVELAMNRGSAL